MAKKDSDSTTVAPSSDNMFKELGLPNPEELLVKASLIKLANKTIKEKGWTQKQTAKYLGTTVPKVADMSKGRLKNLSVENLMLFLTTLDHEVTIVVKQAQQQEESRIVIPKRQVEKKKAT